MKIAAALGGLIILIGLAGLGFMYSGLFNVAATESHTELGRWILDTTMENSVRYHAKDITAPSLEDAQIEAGFRLYRRTCVTCHGAPGIASSALGQGLTPPPPDLAKESQKWAPPELYWIIKHGIRMTGMPAWGPTHTDDELWKLVAFVNALPELSPEDYQQLASAEKSEAATSENDQAEEKGQAEDQPQDAQDQPQDAEPAVTVTMTDQLRFTPQRVEIAAGETILWKNTSQLMHTVTAVPEKASQPKNVALPEGSEPFNSGNLQPDDTFRHTFAVPGEYRYFCIPHELAGMVGTVIVKPR